MTIVLLFVTSCSKNSIIESYPKLEQQLSNNNPSIEKMRVPETGGNNQQYDNVIIDYSNTNLGYIIVKSLTEEHNKYKLGISFGDEILYYDINIDNQYICYPLSFDNGDYNIKLYENISETNYVLFGSLNFEVQLDDKLSPYLYPNVISNYDENSKAVQASFEIVEGSINDLERVSMIYEWVIKNIDYDYDKLEEARKTFLIPDVDLTYTSKKGICFDYSSLMCAMLRPLNIPTKLVTGYVDQGYHAWVEVYIEDIGWIDPEIYFESKIWKLMDPTFGSTNFSYQGDYETVKNY
jgi:hypothetical protein